MVTESKMPMGKAESAELEQPALQYVGFRVGFQRFKRQNIATKLLGVSSLAAMLSCVLFPQVSVFVFLIGLFGVICAVSIAERRENLPDRAQKAE